MIRFEAVEKRYGEKRVVGLLDLEVGASRTMVLLGPSGCGKSTMLRMVLGLVVPTSGRVVFDGEVVSRATRDGVRRRTGYVVQDGGLFPHLTARGNVSLQALDFGWEAGRVEARIAELAELTSFPSDGLERYPGELSGGQRQRVALMRGLMLEPDVLLLDEPLGALDPITRTDLQGDLKRIFVALGKTVLMVTHDLAEAARIGDEIVLMREGIIAQRGTFADLSERPADEFVARFVAAERGVVGGER